jgi:hypothetical protein
MSMSRGIPSVATTAVAANSDLGMIEYNVEFKTEQAQSSQPIVSEKRRMKERKGWGVLFGSNQNVYMWDDCLCMILLGVY